MLARTLLRNLKIVFTSNLTLIKVSFVVYSILFIDISNASVAL
jgi:hypothetical protein